MGWKVIFTAGLVVLLTSAAAAEKRVALVVGNSAYQNVPRLDNPRSDALLMAETLGRVGFVLVGGGAQVDLDKSKFDLVVQSFGKQLVGADVALFYYAGHGLQVRGTNYLVPVTANPTREADVDFQLFDVSLILRQMEGAGTKLNLVILDACRNNPFGGRGLRASDGGLAQLRAPEGTLLSYATQPGNVALDGDDGHSPYTKALAQAILTPGLNVFETFNEVGLTVKRATAGSQQPWVSLSPIDGSFYFSGRAAGQIAVAAPTTSVPLQSPSLSEKIPPAETPTSKSRYFRVVDDVSQGILNMRAAPSSKAPIIVAIPAGTIGLKVGDCRRTDDGNYPWCEIRWREYEGWTSSCCIVEMNAETRRSFRVLSNVSQGILNIRNGPGSRHALIGSMPAGATDVFVSSCHKSDDDEKPWCKVEWRGYRGWASSCCLVDSETGAYARVGEQ